MSDIVAILGALTQIFTAIGVIATAFISWNNNKKLKGVQEDVKMVEHATNGMKQALEQAARNEGHEQGLREGRAQVREMPASPKQGGSPPPHPPHNNRRVIHWEEKMSEEIIIDLKHPIQALGEEVLQIRLTRPKVKQLRAMDSCTGNVARVCALIGEIAALPPSSVDQIDCQDFMEITAKLADFFGLSLLIGRE